MSLILQLEAIVADLIITIAHHLWQRLQESEEPFCLLFILHEEPSKLQQYPHSRNRVNRRVISTGPYQALRAGGITLAFLRGINKY